MGRDCIGAHRLPPVALHSSPVLLLVNRDKPEAAAAAGPVRALIEGFAPVVGELNAEVAGPPIKDALGAEIVVVLGGDGTLLSQTRRCVDLGLPLLGVNFGKLGFMAEFDLPTFKAQASELFGGASPPRTTELGLIHATVDGGVDTPRFEGIAVNECVITAGPPFRMISLGLRIDGQSGPVVSGDGLIVSTAVGSTAYNVSAGGPIVAPGVAAWSITPIAAHSLSFRPIVVPESSRVEIEVREVNPGGTMLVLDGQVLTPLGRGTRVALERDPRRVRFVRNPRGGYWATLISKMHWASVPKA